MTSLGSIALNLMVIFICDAINLAWGDRMVITRNISMITLPICEGTFSSDLLGMINRTNVDGAVLQPGLKLTDLIFLQNLCIALMPSPLKLGN